MRQVEAVAVKQVEHVVTKAVLAASFQVRLQIVETGDAISIFNDDFPIKQRRPDAQFLQSCGDAAKTFGPVEVLAR